MTQQASSQGDYRSQMIRRGPASGRIEKARNPRQALVRLAFYLGAYKATLFIVLGFVLISTVLGLVGPYLMGRAIDGYIATGDKAGLAVIVGWMLAVFLAGSLADAVSAWLMARVSQGALKTVRRELFGHLQTLPLRFFDNHSAGELMSRLTNDIDAINTAVSQNVVALLASALSLGGILIAMFVLNFWLALASVIVVPIMFWFTEFVARYTRRGFRDLQKNLGALNGVMEEAISGQRVVKAFRRDESAAEIFRRHNQEVYRAGVYANSYALLLMPLTAQLGNLFVIAIAGLGGWLALRNLVTVGTIVTFISYGRNFINPLRQLANMYNSIQAALAGAERVFEIIDTPSEVDAAPGAATLDGMAGQVRFDHVRFSYVADTPVIKDMSLEARPGEMVALVGPTGAGKTTIVNLLSRFYELDGGRISIDGRDIREVGKADLRRRLGVVLQDTFLFSASVIDNIRYGRPDATDEEVIEAARIADADHFIRQLPQGYQTMLSERAGNLSQGQRQLLAIARAVLADPAILILDEATSSVDTRTEARIQKALLRLMQGRTSFVIAHRLSTIRDADNVVVIRDGEIAEQGTYRQLLDRRGFFYHLYMSQFKGEAI
ncbi:MAG: putative ABC transporter ATP-binding protein [Chloroflexi bacterium ADurb.Bin325]|nr:MAG: putative ABC transporter ATP-binding protein [Chloroflexi bacterium ADurb.Bin325]